MARRVLYLVSNPKRARRICRRRGGDLWIEPKGDLSWARSLDIEKTAFDRDYLDFVAFLASSASSQFWWANSLSEKNEMLSPLYERLYTLTAIVRVVERENRGCLVAVCRQHSIAASVAAHFRDAGWDVHDEVSGQRILSALRNAIRFVIKFFFITGQHVYRIWRTRIAMDARMKAVCERKDLYVLKTWWDHRNAVGETYVDPYFGEVPSFLNQRVNLVIAADVVRDFGRHLNDIRRQTELCVIPLEAFSRIPSLARAIWTVWTQRPAVATSTRFRGGNVASLLRAELAENYFSQKFFANVLYYFKVKDFLSAMRSRTFIYTFENYAWEKMCVLACREAKVKSVGFQHAFIAQNSFKYFLGRNEAQAVPHPDRIVTMGNATKEILEKKALWPAGLSVVGGAFRQKALSPSLTVDRRKHDILVALTMTEDDTVKMLNFIHASGIRPEAGNVIFRFHPQTDVKRVFEQIAFAWPAHFKRSEASSVYEDFRQVGIVLYTWTTVCLEAVAVGLPAVYINVHFPYSLNPLFDCPYLNTSVSRPEDLMPAIEALRSLKDEDYQKQRGMADSYMKNYFYPPSEKAMEQFIS